VRSGPVAGREQEYNSWYSDQHLDDVIAVPGFVSAQRFRLVDPAAEGAPRQPYLAIYRMHTDDPLGVFDGLRERSESGQLEISEAFDQEGLDMALYEAITPVVSKG
jgi:hypothetical protein